MVKPARIVEENGKQYVELTLKSASYWKSFELFDHDKKLNVTTVSEDQSADTKIIRFEKPKYLKVLTSKVHIVVPAINYDNHYTTRIEFDKEATSGNVNTNTSDEQNLLAHQVKMMTLKVMMLKMFNTIRQLRQMRKNPNLRMLHLEKIVQQIIVHQLPHLQIKL